ncbi:BTB/POZ and MATH domain-containing protein [Skeletonema marinoi]|uniref:BTB/POZ and MATH domain-containing protein n=1 Tax=Skeletonema marinoi TaxID=267567 RepID=A0AAD8Y4Z9_9STRA|nr:BTB/POZ and MATH domain-containing protein [Skeletonema marinoi]
MSSAAAALPLHRIRIINDASVSKSTKMTQFKFLIKKFDTLPTARNHCVPIEFTFNGHKWILGVYPGGLGVSANGYVSIYLGLCAEVNIAVTFAVALLDKFGHPKRVRRINHRFDGTGVIKKLPSSGWNDFIAHSDILDASKNILGDDDELTLVVSIEIEQPATAFVPIDAKHTLVKMIQGMFRDQETADVLFEVSKMEANEDGTKRGKSYVHFPAHRSILQGCAPMLAALFGTSNKGELATVAVHDVKPKVFRHLLWYVYGGTVSNEALKADAKDIIDTADKYSIAGLKLAAEAALVESTNITVENAIDNLLYADSKNLAVLKEAVVDFLVDNGKEVSSKASFNDLPGHVVKDVLVATARKEDKKRDADDIDMMRVSELRRKLHQKGLDVDGSREAMIDALKSNSF